MKKTGFFLAAVLLMATLVFTGCGSRDDNRNAVPDSQQNSITEDIEEGAEDVKDGVEDAGEDLEREASDIGEDIEDGAEDVKDDVKKASDAQRDSKERDMPSEVQ